jgi:hypothetical protein
VEEITAAARVMRAKATDPDTDGIDLDRDQVVDWGPWWTPAAPGGTPPPSTSPPPGFVVAARVKVAKPKGGFLPVRLRRRHRGPGDQPDPDPGPGGLVHPGGGHRLPLRPPTPRGHALCHRTPAGDRHPHYLNVLGPLTQPTPTSGAGVYDPSSGTQPRCWEPGARVPS